MKVLKFGGGCLKDANSIKKLPIILKKYTNSTVLLVLSAFGKTTNMLEGCQYQLLFRVELQNHGRDHQLRYSFS